MFHIGMLAHANLFAQLKSSPSIKQCGHQELAWLEWDVLRKSYDYAKLYPPDWFSYKLRASDDDDDFVITIMRTNQTMLKPSSFPSNIFFFY